MTEPRRLAADHLVTVLVLTFALLAAGCAGPAASPSAASARPIATPTAEPSPRSHPSSLSPVPGATPTAVIGPSLGRPGTTEVTGFGPILDSLPPSFPKLAGQEAAETGAGPASGSFTADVDVTSASASILSALRAKGWTVDAGAPLEDGTVVVEASRPAGCKVEIRFTPRSGSVIMTVLYGASCPYP